MRKKRSIHCIAKALLPTQLGKFQIAVFCSKPENKEHVVLYMGKFSKKSPVLVRIHSQCLTGDTLLSLRCDCRDQLKLSLKKISKKQNGMLIYLNQEGRGIGLSNKIKAYHLQDQGLDTVQANIALGFLPDERDYWVAAKILKHFHIQKVDVLTNNPDKISDLKKYGIQTIKRIPLTTRMHTINKKYILSKKTNFGHLIP